MRPARDAARAAHINTQSRRSRNFAPQSGGAQPRGRIQMSMLLTYVKSFVREEEGQDLLEYALLVALIALIAIGAVGMAGESVSTIFSDIATELNGAAGS
jgi:pilus assembly protein Flp/PilA